MADERCSKRVPAAKNPEGWTREAMATHPKYRYLLEPTAQCALDAGHEPPHATASGLLRWYDPPLLTVGGDEAA